MDLNLYEDLYESELIYVESMDFSDDQTCLYISPQDSGKKVDIMEWCLSLVWPKEKVLNTLTDTIKHGLSLPDKQKFDSRTYVRPKKQTQRPSIHSIVESTSNPASISPAPSLNPAHSNSSKYMTYNKYSNPLGVLGPMLRLKTFNMDVHTENSTAVKEFTSKCRSSSQNEDPQLEEMNDILTAETSERLSMDHAPSTPINIDLTQPAHFMHNTFNIHSKGLTNMMNDRGSLNMYQSGESLMRMSPPSLVSSLMMETSGNFNPESLEGRRSMPSHKDSGLPSGRDSIDPMMTSMTLSILDEKDMSTSFLSQTTNPDNDSFMNTSPPSLISSINSSYIANSSKPKEESNIFSSATFTHLEQSEKLLSARPRCQLYNSFKRDSSIKNSESYTKAREEACQIDAIKVLNDKESHQSKIDNMAETITLHFANNKFRTDAEKENFERDDTFYKDMGITKPDDGKNSLTKPDDGKNSLNLTMGKQELNEIIQARQKLSLARKGLPSEPDRLPNQVDAPPIKTIQLPNQIITVPRQSVENASELLARRRVLNGFEKEEPPTRETPKRNSTFRKLSPRASAIDTTVVHVKETQDPQSTDIIDINSATLNLIDCERTLQQEEWCAQERAMVGSNESTDTGTYSSSSPPNSVPEATHHPHSHAQVSSTPQTTLRKSAQNEFLNLHSTISPIVDTNDDKPYNYNGSHSSIPAMERTYDLNNTNDINSTTLIKKSSKKDIPPVQPSPERRMPPPTQMRKPSCSRAMPSTVTYASMAPPSGVHRQSNLPTSKLRQYSSHRELSKIPAGPSGLRAPPGRCMVRRNVYASNPTLSPTATAPVEHYAMEANLQKMESKPRPVLTNPPALIRQGTETLRRERPQSQLVAPRDPPSTRPYSIAGASQVRVNRPASGPIAKPAPVVEQSRPASSNDTRLSGLPRPTRLPAPRRGLRPPSVYSVAPAGDAEKY